MNPTDSEKPRGCQCGLWKKDPAFLEDLKVPRGHCGFCQTCGKPGHTRHFPGSMPYTGCWCDFHHRMVSILHPLGHPGSYVYRGLVVVGFVLWVLLRR